MGNFDFIRILKFLPGIILGLTVHEFSHAFVALLCGDSTARDQGRITLNPLKHIDPLGFIMLMVAGFGWARPVQFREENLRNPRTDVIKIALAGPLSNAFIAMILSVLFAVLVKFIPVYTSHTSAFIYDIIMQAIWINWVLFVFNLIPLPPLDGSHLFLHQFKKFPSLYAGLYKYGSLIFFGLILVTSFTKINLLPIGPVIQFLTTGFLSFLGYS